MSTSRKTETETSSNGTVDSKTNPWAPQAEALTKAFSEAQSAYGQAGSAKAPTDFTAGFTPEQLATFRTMIGQGGDQSVAQRAAGAGAALTGAGVTGAQGALDGYASYDPTKTNNSGVLIDKANQFVEGQDIDAQVRNAMLNATQTARDVTLPGIAQGAAMSGNTNSSRTGIAEGMVTRGLAQQSTDLGANLRSQAFQNGLKLAQDQAQNNNATTLESIKGRGALGSAVAGQGVAAGSQSLTDAGALNTTAMAGGAGLQTADQARLTNQAQQYSAALQSPYANIQQLLAIIGGQNWGSETKGTTSSRGTESKSTTPSIMDVIGGLAGAAGAVMGVPGGKPVG